jgi:putative copper resistance protein D
VRLPGRVARISAWVWPVCFVLIGVMLFFYREA